MKKLKWIILILMLFVGMSYATVELGALEVGAYRVPAPDFYEDFADNLNDWTNDASFAITSGELSVDTSTDYMYVTSPPFVNETYQAIQFELVNGDWSEWKILMRCNSSGDCYGFNINDSLDTLTWVENSNWDDTDQVVEVDAPTIANGDYIGIEVYNTGNNTEVDYWVSATPLGDWDSAHTNWGAPTGTMTNNPTDAHDTGKYGGIAIYDLSSGARLDDLYFYSGS